MRFTKIHTQEYTDTDKSFQNDLSEDLNGILIVSDLNNTGGATARLAHVGLIMTTTRGGTVFSAQGNGATGIDEIINHAEQVYDDATATTAGVTGRAYIPLRQKAGQTIDYNVRVLGTVTDGKVEIYKVTGKPITAEDRIVRVVTELVAVGSKTDILLGGYLDYIGIRDTEIVDGEEFALYVGGNIQFIGSARAFRVYNGLNTINRLPVGRNVVGDSRIETTATIATPYVLGLKFTNPVGRAATPAEREAMARAAEAGRRIPGQGLVGSVAGGGFGLM